MPSLLHTPSRSLAPLLARRTYAIPSATQVVPRKPAAPRAEGSIADVFATMSDASRTAWPQRFVDLKKEIWRDELVESWREVLSELEVATEEIAVRGNDMIPQIQYADVAKGMSPGQVGGVKKAGAIIVKGGVSAEEALAWKSDIKSYAAANKPLVRGFPPDNIQFFELYNSPAQQAARTHPALVTTQRALLQLWHASDPNAHVSLGTPVSYFDRLRIRQPGRMKTALGPHIDGGGVERWEDPGFRSCFASILEGRWREHDSFDVAPRLNANQDLYNSSNQCTVFRPWQGWTSLSSCAPGEGTLRLLPELGLTTAYLMLRPLFRPRATRGAAPLAFEDWEPALDEPAFAGCVPGKTIEPNQREHPHLRLETSVVSIPRVEPGDQVYWHCDLVHAVEADHNGTSDSSVLYIPAVPLTLNNAAYMHDQRDNFARGLPAPDFPGGDGESAFVGRATPEDVQGAEARRMLGLEPLEVPAGATPGARVVVEAANRFLF